MTPHERILACLLLAVLALFLFLSYDRDVELCRSLYARARTSTDSLVVASSDRCIIIIRQQGW